MSGEFAPSRVMPLVKAMGAPDAGNPHVRCDEGGGGAFTPPPYSTVLALERQVKPGQSSKKKGACHVKCSYDM